MWKIFLDLAPKGRKSATEQRLKEIKLKEEIVPVKGIVEKGQMFLGTMFIK